MILISIFTNKAKPAYLTRQDFLSSGQNVLGEEEKKDEEENEDKEDEKLKAGGSSGKNGTLELKTQDTGNGRETEIETEDGQKIKTKVEDDGSSKIEIEHNDYKIKYEYS